MGQASVTGADERVDGLHRVALDHPLTALGRPARHDVCKEKSNNT